LLVVVMVHRDGIIRALLGSLAAGPGAAKKLFERSEFLFGLGLWLTYGSGVQQFSLIQASAALSMKSRLSVHTWNLCTSWVSW
jgi:hypothetical protein